PRLREKFDDRRMTPDLCSHDGGYAALVLRIRFGPLREEILHGLELAESSGEMKWRHALICSRVDISSLFAEEAKCLQLAGLGGVVGGSLTFAILGPDELRVFSQERPKPIHATRPRTSVDVSERPDEAKDREENPHRRGRKYVFHLRENTRIE